MVRKSRTPGELASLIQKVPLYRELLREYPQATITVSGKHG